MRLVIVESPYKGDTEAIIRNVAYGRRCMHDCLMRGEAPFASHLLYTQVGVLDDKDSDQRKLGIAAGLAWGARADATVVYCDYGVTEGMLEGIYRAQRENRPVEMRYLLPDGYVGYHLNPDGETFGVFRIGSNWYWIYPAVGKQMGPYSDAKSAYDGALGGQ